MSNSPGMCPRCGGSPIVRERDGYGAYVRCRYCGWLQSAGPQRDGVRTDTRLLPSRVVGLSIAFRKSPPRRSRR